MIRLGSSGVEKKKFASNSCDSSFAIMIGMVESHGQFVDYFLMVNDFVDRRPAYQCLIINRAINRGSINTHSMMYSYYDPLARSRAGELSLPMRTWA